MKGQERLQQQASGAEGSSTASKLDKRGGVPLAKPQPRCLRRCKQLPKVRSLPRAESEWHTITRNDLRKVAEGFCGGEKAVAETSGKACLGRSLKRPLQNRVVCRSANSSTSQRCHKLVPSPQRRQTAQEKPDKSWIAAQCMVLGTVSATDVASQPLRARLHADCATKTTSSRRNSSTAAAPLQAKVYLVHSRWLCQAHCFAVDKRIGLVYLLWLSMFCLLVSRRLSRRCDSGRLTLFL